MSYNASGVSYRLMNMARSHESLSDEEIVKISDSLKNLEYLPLEVAGLKRARLLSSNQSLRQELCAAECHLHNDYSSKRGIYALRN